jgi:DNA-binding CsgD family transcriptional regulator
MSGMSAAEKTVEQALQAIDERWDLWPSIPTRIAEVLCRTMGDAYEVAIHHWQESLVAIDAHTLQAEPRELPWVSEGFVHQARFYDPEQLGIDADRVVAGAELRARDAKKWTIFYETFLRPLQLQDQVRSVITDDEGRFMTFVGVFTPSGTAADPARVELFERLLGPISERLRTWNVLAQSSPERAAVLDLVQDLSKPAFVVAADGTLLFANLAAQLAYDCPPDWLPTAGLDAVPAGVRRIRVTEGSRPVYVCIANEEIQLERLGHWVAGLWGLPPRLHATAAKVIAGRSDKEIALATGLAFATVRTYVRIIYQHVGVTSRGALVSEAMRALHRAGDRQS